MTGLDLPGGILSNRFMPRRVSLLIAMSVLALVVSSLFWSKWTGSPEGETWLAGVARMEITPGESMWMSGYASRDRPSEGTLSPLWAKVLALQDPAGHRVLLVTLDLIGIDRELSLEIRGAIEQKHVLARADILLNTSHTHTGPVVGKNLQPMYALSDEGRLQVERYSAFVRDVVIDLADRALADMDPVVLSYGQGEATFAVNRRNNSEVDVPALRASGMLKGPVDHSVPVLKVVSGEALRAVVFGYACHATVLSSFEWSGDYPGFAQTGLEERYPGTVAMFWAGCGADVNPIPRRSEELARDYGAQLAEAVAQALESPDLRPLQGRVTTSSNEILLDFAEVPSRADLEGRLANENPYVARMARHLLDRPELMERVRGGYPYPVQTWRLGTEVTWIALGGEVVVDYALAIKKMLGEGQPERVWVAGYCNDVMAYIPSLRVLREGGYEGAGAMVYYGLPGPWAEDVETRILDEVRRQSRLSSPTK